MYTIATKDFTTLAEYILAQDEAIVPPKLAALLDQTISLRQSYSATISNQTDDGTESSDSNDRHAFFLNVLKKVQKVLRPRYADTYIPSQKKPKNIEEAINMFEHLDLEEPFEAFEQAPDVTHTNLNTPAPDVKYRAERLDGIQEGFFAFLLLLHELNRLRNEVIWCWEGYTQGLLDLIAASITTNTTVDLARAMEDNH
jgi:hypothetical protein